MRYNKLLLGLFCAVLFLSGCSIKSVNEKPATTSTSSSNKKTDRTKTIETTETTETTEEEKDIVVGKNFEGQMGKHLLSFTFLEGNKYREMSKYYILGETDVCYTEGTYTIRNGEIILKPNSNKSFFVLSKEPTRYLNADENSTKEDFERLYIEEDDSILVTYSLDKELVDSGTMSDDSYGYLHENDTVVKTFDETKLEMQPTKNTRDLFRTVDGFGEWVLAHMSKKFEYSYRVLFDEKSDSNYRYCVNIYAPGYETAPGTTIAIDYDGNMYNDTPRNGNPRNLSRDTNWDELLDTDINAGEIVNSKSDAGKEKLKEMVGKWTIIPSDSYFVIVSDNEIDFFNNPGEPSKNKQVKEAVLEDNELTIIFEDETKIMNLIDNKTLKIGNSTYQKIN